MASSGREEGLNNTFWMDPAVVTEAKLIPFVSFETGAEGVVRLNGEWLYLDGGAPRPIEEWKLWVKIIGFNTRYALDLDLAEPAEREEELPAELRRADGTVDTPAIRAEIAAANCPRLLDWFEAVVRLSQDPKSIRGEYDGPEVEALM